MIIECRLCNFDPISLNIMKLCLGFGLIIYVNTGGGGEKPNYQQLSSHIMRIILFGGGNSFTKPVWKIE